MERNDKQILLPIQKCMGYHNRGCILKRHGSHILKGCLNTQVLHAGRHATRIAFIKEAEIEAARQGPGLLLPVLKIARKHMLQVLRRYLFEQEIKHTEPQCLLCIFQIAVARNEDNGCPRHFQRHAACKLQSIHARHANVRNEEIRLFFAAHFQRGRPVVGHAAYLTLILRPVHHSAQAIQRPFFVVRQHNAVHHYSSFSTGRMISTAIPCFSSAIKRIDAFVP